MSKVIKFGSIKHYPVNEEILQRIIALIYEYDGEVSLVAVLGILDLVKDQIKSQD